EIFQWTSLSLKETKANEKVMAELKKELADVFIYALDMSVLLGMDTEEIILEKLASIKEKYPAEAMRKNAKAGSGSGEDDEYWRIKNEYRKKEK
ncbi:MAG TPA: MazG-like family protein, partial [Candidatus Paceibacterota bacterium]|nr:MazG-like family protein [Candidatus Paceibacterota bacterium]